MKRLGNVWEKTLVTEIGVRAVIEGTRQKRDDRSVQSLLYSDDAVKKNPSLWHQIDINKAHAYIKPVFEELNNHTWKHSKPRHRLQYCRNKTHNGGKWRDLYIPELKDHIIHHIIMMGTMEAFTRGMHPNCCGSVPKRGIKHILRKCKSWFQNDHTCRYFVKLDIRHFFDTIDREKLICALQRKIKDKNALWVHEEIINSAPVACPIGYYTSPWYANLYLEGLDWHIEQDLYKMRRGKRIKYVKHYLRYADDILLLGTSKTDLRKSITSISEYLAGLGLEIKPSWEIKAIGKHELVDGIWRMKPGTYWCDIGGYKFCRDAVIMRDGIFLAARRLARKMYKQGYYKDKQCKSLQSRLGWAEHSDSKYFYENEIIPYVNLKAVRRQISDVDKERKRRTNQTGSG